MKTPTAAEIIQRMYYYGCRPDREALSAALAGQEAWSVPDIIKTNLDTDTRLDILLHSDLLTPTQLRQFACDCASRILHQEQLFGRTPDLNLHQAILLARRSIHQPEQAQELRHEARALCQPVVARLHAEFQEQDTEAAALASEVAEHIRYVAHSPAHQAASSLAMASYGCLIPGYKDWQLEHLKTIATCGDNRCPTCSAKNVPLARCVHCGVQWCPKCYDAPDFESRHGCKCSGYYTVACGRCGSVEPGPYWLFQHTIETADTPLPVTFTMCASCANDHEYEHPGIFSGMPT